MVVAIQVNLITGDFKFAVKIYPICVMTRCAETGRVPPASGVIVNAVELPAGFRTVRIELIM
ncbi:MAG: hypothetical protein PUC88_05470 [Clostridia bacterium]|nr:hypothetical protein [Clostridia bacterium]